MLIAITRPVSPSIVQCELTHLERALIDLELARQQHRGYQESLAALGCRVLQLPEEPDLPDAVFVEDAALVLDELAVITRPGAESRRAEGVSVARALSRYRKLAFIQAPGTLDGGDVLRVGKRIFAGSSSRSNRAGIEQLRGLLAPYGYAVRSVEVSGCLHLKSAATQVAENTLLVNRAWVDVSVFEGIDLIDVDPAEPYAANALFLDGGVIYPAAFPATRRRLATHGFRVHEVDVSELTKAEGAVTCCSLVFETKDVIIGLPR